MSEIAILNELIKDSAKISAIKRIVELTESKCQDSKIIIKGIPDNSITIKIDFYNSPDSIFKGSKGESKRSDFAIISNSNNKKRIIIIELKKTKDSEKEVINQMKGTLCFIEYCKKIVKEFWGEDNFLASFQYRFIGFYHTNITKGTTSLKKKSNNKNDSPQQMMKIQYVSMIHFNKIED